jgi:hypothetical protein
VAALERVKSVIAKLDESEAKLAETESRAKQSRQRNARLLAQIETYKKTIGISPRPSAEAEYETRWRRRTPDRHAGGPGRPWSEKSCSSGKAADRHGRQPDAYKNTV